MTTSKTRADSCHNDDIDNTNGKVLLIVVDQLRADCLHGALASHVKTPNLNKLMSEGVTFTNHYSVTSPCGPARSSLLTGLYAMNHRSIRNGTPLDQHHPNIATEIRKCGYEPLLFGYTDTSADPRGYHPNDPALKTYEQLAPGFSEIVQLRQGDSAQWIADLKTKGYDLPSEYWDIYRSISEDPKKSSNIIDPALYSAEDSDTAFLTEQTQRALSVRSHLNYLALVAYIRPHPPLVAPAPYNSLYDPHKLPYPMRPKSLRDEIEAHPFCEAFFSSSQNSQLFIGFDGRQEKLNDEQTQMLRAVYFGLVTELDEQIGSLLKELKDTGEYDNTLIILTADHGEMLGDHFMWGKACHYDPAYHIPLIIRNPHQSSNAGKQVTSFTESIDVAPTILEWCGGELPLGFNGRSLQPLLRGETPPDWRTHVFCEFDYGDPVTPTAYQSKFAQPAASCNLAILREEKMKYVHFNGGLPPLLFDMSTDPDEQTNLADNPDFTGERLRLASAMLDHRMSHANHALSRMKVTEDGIKSG